MRNLLLGMFIVLLLGGCAELVTERNGVEVELVPVTYSFKAKVTKDNKAKVDEQLSKYLELHKDKVFTEQIYLGWNGKAAKSKVMETQRRLLKLGVDPKSITVHQIQTQTEGAFNLTASLQKYQVLVPSCKASQVNRYGFQSNDCFVESARWISLQHPEKMVGHAASDSQLGK